MDLRHTQRLFVNAQLGAGQALTISGDQAHYLQHVIRLKPGETIRLFNGQDGEWAGSIGTLGKRETVIHIQQQTRPQSPQPDIQLCCAPIKKAHFEYMIEKATELGVSSIRPLLTSRTQIRDVNIERCTSIATEAAEQSDRLSVPRIEKPITLNDLAASFPAGQQLVVCAEVGEATAVRDAFQSHSLKTVSAVTIVTGPEGGFAADELEKLRKISNGIFIRLGPRILRADTAAIAALSCWQAIQGDWTRS
ncbi:MAG TPA: 16S rRNA (uracil(1498)-N(3))-methyltransferase [Alphaproteobacteria bacterium]|nr:16S rRNA (uracil(1498)-N(3))-methyltransferase [Alphaproteobacteria bacterium]